MVSKTVIEAVITYFWGIFKKDLLLLKYYKAEL